mmetsp:Transcript_14733/g.14338  ORF Transcript_14733/g.14338 Transcript_14733/m.14338 type:complete len:111 (+) Transcript_14733:178-510(+)
MKQQITDAFIGSNFYAERKYLSSTLFQEVFQARDDIFILRIIDSVSSTDQMSRALYLSQPSFFNEHYSDILEEQRKGYNVIISEISEDIMRTLEFLNMTSEEQSDALKTM